jgi:hypothetical protein
VSCVCERARTCTCFVCRQTACCRDVLQLKLCRWQTGHTFERINIEAHLARSSICPLSGVLVEDKKLVPNYALRNIIEDYIRGQHTAATIVSRPPVEPLPPNPATVEAQPSRKETNNQCLATEPRELLRGVEVVNTSRQ